MYRILLVHLLCLVVTSGFVPSQSRKHRSSLKATSADYALLQERVDEMRRTCLEKDWTRPPNANLSPEQFCTLLLEGLQCPDDPFPDSGFRTLLRASTTKWRTAIHESIGAPPLASPEIVASALSTAMGNNGNQFQLLLQPGIEFVFPNEPLDFMDGTCWLQVELRKPGRLLAVLGFSLVKEREAWMLDRMDWQDYRG